MAKNDNVKAEREVLVKMVHAATGVALLRNKNYTGGLSVSNKDMWANGIAHLLCNGNNFPIVKKVLADFDALKDGSFIHEDFQARFDFASVLYACGTAPRIVLNVNRHKSKDAAMTGSNQEFITWAQAWRLQNTDTAFIGQSRSVHKARFEVAIDPLVFTCADFMCMDMGYNTDERHVHQTEMPAVVVITDEVKRAIDAQKQMRLALTEGGVELAAEITKGKGLADALLAMQNRRKAIVPVVAATPKVVTPKVKKSEKTDDAATPAVKKVGGRKAKGAVAA